ncbi:MAG: DUF3105 domain-containing protein [Solirubrobacteraceae bacterium]
MDEARLIRLLERLAIAAVSLAVSIGAIAALSGFFAGRDAPGVSGGGSTGPGLTFKDLGHAHLQPGQSHPAYNSRPPTSGAHFARAVTRERARLSVDQLLESLELGDVVIEYGGSRPPPGLRELARSLAPPFTPALAAAGQAVILARRSRTAGLIALSWTHVLQVSAPSDRTLREFVQSWLGRGAPGR